MPIAYERDCAGLSVRGSVFAFRRNGVVEENFSLGGGAVVNGPDSKTGLDRMESIAPEAILLKADSGAWAAAHAHRKRRLVHCGIRPAKGEKWAWREAGSDHAGHSHLQYCEADQGSAPGVA